MEGCDCSVVGPPVIPWPTVGRAACPLYLLATFNLPYNRGPRKPCLSTLPYQSRDVKV